MERVGHNKDESRGRPPDIAEMKSDRHRNSPPSNKGTSIFGIEFSVSSKFNLPTKSSFCYGDKMHLPRYSFANNFTEFEKIFYDNKIKTQHFSPGEYLCKPGDMFDKCHYITSGSVRLSMVADNGNEIVVCFYQKGTIVPLIITETRFSIEPYLVLNAISEVDVISISKKWLIDFVKTSHAFALAALEHFAWVTNLLEVRELLVTEADSVARTCSYLFLELNSFPNKDNIIFCTQEKLATVIGVTRVQIARVFAMLREEEIIDTQRNHIQVLSVKKLKDKCISIINIEQTKEYD